MTSNTQRTLKALRAAGWTAEVVEKWIPYHGKNPQMLRAGGVRVDLFGFIDIVAFKDNQIMAIQSTGQNFKAHDEKIKSIDLALGWIQAGGILELWGWRKVRDKSKPKAMKWDPRVYRYGTRDWVKAKDWLRELDL